MENVNHQGFSFENLPKHVSELLNKVDRLSSQISEFEKSQKGPDPDELLTVVEAAMVLKCNKSTIYNLIKNGKLPKYGLSDLTRIRRGDIINAFKKIV